MKRLIALAVAPVAVAVVIAGCGGGSNSSSNSGASSGSTKTTAAKTAGGTAVSIRTTSLGRTLVDGKGRTLYLFENDKSPTSTCNGACASVWPPLTSSGKPQPGSGISAGKLGVTTRSDGQSEVTYAGHPLYYYVSDTQPGQVAGEGLDQFGAKWYAVAPSGKSIDKD